LTGVFSLGGFMDDDDFLRDVVLFICAACLLMVIGASLAMLALRLSPAFWQLIL
jgi:hypothetical protein